MDNQTKVEIIRKMMTAQNSAVLRPNVVLHTEWKQACRKFIYEELKKVGVLPMMERN